MPKYYLVQEIFPDGTFIEILKPAAQIIRDLGFRDCSGSEFVVYDVITFGKVVKLEEEAGDAPNHHKLVNPETGEVVIDGYSPEH